MIPRDHVASLERVTKNQVSALRSYQNSTPVKGSWESCRRLERSAFLLQEERICRRGVLFQRGRFCWGEGRYFFGGWYHFQKGWLVGIERDIRALREESLAWEKKELKHLEDESRVTRKKKKSERAFSRYVWCSFFFIISTHDSVFFIFYFLWLSLIFWALDDCSSMWWRITFLSHCLSEYGSLLWWNFVDAFILIFVMTCLAAPLVGEPLISTWKGIPLWLCSPYLFGFQVSCVLSCSLISISGASTHISALWFTFLDLLWMIDCLFWPVLENERVAR